MAEKLKIVGGRLDKGIASLAAAESFFDLVQDRANESADACGHGGLARALRESSNNWSIRRGKLAEALENLGGHLRTAKETFGNVDDELARMVTDDGSSAVVSGGGPGSGEGVVGGEGPEESAQTGGASQGVGPGAQPAPPATPAWSAQAVQNTAEGEAVAGVSATTGPPDGGTDAPAVLRGGQVTTGPAVPTTSPHATSVQHVLFGIVDQWVRLGGTPETFLKAVSVVAAAGLLAGVLANRQGDGSRRSDLRLDDLFPNATDAVVPGDPTRHPGGAEADARTPGSPDSLPEPGAGGPTLPEPALAPPDGAADAPTGPDDARSADPLQTPEGLAVPSPTTVHDGLEVLASSDSASGAALSGSLPPLDVVPLPPPAPRVAEPLPPLPPLNPSVLPSQVEAPAAERASLAPLPPLVPGPSPLSGGAVMGGGGGTLPPLSGAASPSSSHGEEVTSEQAQRDLREILDDLRRGLEQEGETHV